MLRQLHCWAVVTMCITACTALHPRNARSIWDVEYEKRGLMTAPSTVPAAAAAAAVQGRVCKQPQVGIATPTGCAASSSCC
jgi:hypothetical protein